MGEAAEVPYRYLFPSALFFICIGVYAANNSLFEVGEMLVFGVFGYILLRLRLPGGADPAGLRARTAGGGEFPARLLMSRGDLMIFVKRPISAFFLRSASC